MKDHCEGGEDTAAAATAVRGKKHSSTGGTETRLRRKWTQRFLKEHAIRETTCVPDASWKQGRAFAINYIHLSQRKFVTDFWGSSFKGNDDGRGQPRYDL